MGTRKQKVLVLNLDNTYTFKKVKVNKGLLDISKSWKPGFKPGRSIFPHASTKGGFWSRFKRKPKSIAVVVEGETQAFELTPKSGRILGTSWTLGELVDYIAKIVHLSLVKSRLMSNIQTYVLFGLVGATFVVGILILRRVGV